MMRPGPSGTALYGGGYSAPDLSAECYVIIGGTRCIRGRDHAAEHGTEPRTWFERARANALVAKDLTAGGA